MAAPEFIGEVRVPSKTTLRKYGLTRDEWEAILRRQGLTCAVCGKVPGTKGTLHIDHEHVAGWKKMEPAERKRYVRGLVCWFDNGVLLRRGASPERLRAAADYLAAYAERRHRNV